MKNKLTTIILTSALLITATPIYANAETCTEHQWGDWYEITAPSCLFNGTEARNCEKCHERELGSIPATGHQWGEWKTIEEPTCGKNGFKIKECTICHTDEREIIPATGEHQWNEWIVYEEPDCEYTGSEYRECAICHEEEEKEIPATAEHDWSRWETKKKATALSEGKQSRYCIDCYTTEKKSIPKLKAKITLKEKSATIESGKSHKIKIKSKTYGDKVKKWTSSNKKVATVDSHGKVTGKQNGTTTITLKMQSGIKATCKINVTKPKPNTDSRPGKSHSGGSGSHSGGSNTTAPSSGYVWIPNTGSKYHKTSTCSGMKGPHKVTVEEAKSQGYGPCSKCY